MEGVSFSVDEGELVGIVGADGAGKTTLLRMIAGLSSADEGRITVRGIDVAKHPRALSAHVGYAAQQVSLYGDLTVAQNLHFVADLYSLPRNEYRRRERELLELTGLSRFRARLVADLSGGMRQKAALAATLLPGPEILLLDEPTLGLDPISRRDIWDILYALVARGMTALVATSNVSEAERCTRAGLLHQGRLLQMAPPRDIREGMKQKVLEINGLPATATRDGVQALEGVMGVNVLGGRVRVVCRNVACAQRVREWVQYLARGGTVREVGPTLEEAFAALIGGGGDG